MKNLLIFFIYTFCTLLLFLPVLKDIDSTIPGKLGDPLLNLWIISWDIHTFLDGNISNIFDANIFFPYENTLTYSENLFAIAVVALPFYLITGSYITAYIIVFLLSFIFTAYCMYYFLKELVPSHIAAFAGGFIFAFNPWRLGHISHIQVLAAWWIPLCFWALLRYHRSHKIIYAVAFAVFFVFNALSNAHYMLFTTVAVVIFELCLLSFCLYNKEKLQWNKNYLLHGALVLLIIVPPILLAYVPYLKAAEMKNFKRPVQEIVKYSSEVGNYVALPSHNPVWKKFTYAQKRVFGMRVFPPGFIQVIIVIGGLLVLLRRSIPADNKRMLLSLGVVGLFGFLLSFGPVLGHIGRWAIPGPYAMLRVLPGFSSVRAPSRFAVFVYFAVALLAALLVWSLGKRLSGASKVLYVVIFAVLIIEFVSCPHIFTKIPGEGKCPDAYKWLNEQPYGAVAEFPMTRQLATRYMLYSTCHWKPLMNGYSGYFPPLDQYLKRAPLTKQVKVAHDKGVKYIIVHKNIMNKDELRLVFKKLRSLHYQRAFAHGGVWVGVKARH